MAESQYSTFPILLGPGGRITDPRLIEVLENTPILKPREVLKLAIYFTAFPTNIHLGEVLWGSGLATILANPLVRRATLEAFGFDIVAYEGSYEETWENLIPFIDDDNDSDDTGAKQQPIDTHDNDDTEINDQSFLFTGIFGVGLLIEKRFLANEEVGFFVDGVCPDPNTLPEPVNPKASAPSN